MSDINEQILAIEKEIRETPYHKGTEHHIGMLRARIARLKDKIIEAESRVSGGGGGGYAVKKHGDATVVLVGPPSVGKSTLINKLTNAKSKIAEYAFTTLSVIPGMMEYKGAKIQIFDVPGLIQGAEVGKGRGKEVLSVIRNANLVIIITEPDKFKAFTSIYQSLMKNGIRVNHDIPDIKIEKQIDGGIFIKTNIKQDISKETMKQMVLEMGIKNAIVTINEKTSIERFLDSLSRNRVYIPGIYVLNKIDKLGSFPELEKEIHPNIIRVSLNSNEGIDTLKERIWEKLQFKNIFLVQKDEEPSESHPMIVRNNSNLEDVANQIGINFRERIKTAHIWGPGAKFPEQEVSLQTKVLDGMKIRFS